MYCFLPTNLQTTKMTKRTTFSALIVLLAHSIFAQCHFSLKDYYSEDSLLQATVDSVYETLTDTQRVGQLLITSAGQLGYEDSKVFKLVADGKVGSVIYLKDTKENHASRSSAIDSIASAHGQLPVLIGMDAEPSLVNGRIKGIDPVLKTSQIQDSLQADSIAHLIDAHLKDIGVQHNYAPVCDISTANAAITNRSFGNNTDTVEKLALSFIQATQRDTIAAMAKHFPGHGLVKGDTHKQSVYIDGELKELPVYKPLIDAGVISVMVGHITIKNNPQFDTDGMPASLSRNIVTGLLKDSLGFRGIVMTDALNIMKAVNIYENSSLLAMKAGNDMLCMPADEDKAIASILAEMETDASFRKQVIGSVKKAIRLKVCLGIL